MNFSEIKIGERFICSEGAVWQRILPTHPAVKYHVNPDTFWALCLSSRGAPWTEGKAYHWNDVPPEKVTPYALSNALLRVEE